MSRASDPFTVAIPVERGRVARLFDTAGKVLVVELAGGEEISRRVVDSPGDEDRDRVDVLRSMGVEALVCGGISGRSLYEALHQGLRVWSAVAGKAERVIDSLAATGDIDEGLAMPVAPTLHFFHEGALVDGDGPLVWGWRVDVSPTASVSHS